jgi:hypothetical protein
MAAIQPPSLGSSLTTNAAPTSSPEIWPACGALTGDPIPGGDTLYPTKPDLAKRIWQATFPVTGGARAGLASDGLMLSRTQPWPQPSKTRNPHRTIAAAPRVRAWAVFVRLTASENLHHPGRTRLG